MNRVGSPTQGRGQEKHDQGSGCSHLLSLHGWTDELNFAGFGEEDGKMEKHRCLFILELGVHGIYCIFWLFDINFYRLSYSRYVCCFNVKLMAAFKVKLMAALNNISSKRKWEISTYLMAALTSS
jgi:hypothetical protein